MEFHVSVLSRAVSELFSERSCSQLFDRPDFVGLYCKPDTRLTCNFLNFFRHVSFLFTQARKCCQGVCQGHYLPKVSQKVSAQLFFSYTESLAHCFAASIGGITPVISMKGLQRRIWPTELTLMRHRGCYQLKGQSLFLL